MFIIVTLEEDTSQVTTPGRVYGPFHTRGKAVAHITHTIAPFLRDKKGYETVQEAGSDVSPDIPVLTVRPRTPRLGVTPCNYFVRPILDPEDRLNAV